MTNEELVSLLMADEKTLYGYSYNLHKVFVEIQNGFILSYLLDRRGNLRMIKTFLGYRNKFCDFMFGEHFDGNYIPIIAHPSTLWTKNTFVRNLLASIEFGLLDHLLKKKGNLNPFPDYFPLLGDSRRIDDFVFLIRTLFNLLKNPPLIALNFAFKYKKIPFSIGRTINIWAYINFIRNVVPPGESYDTMFKIVEIKENGKIFGKNYSSLNADFVDFLSWIRVEV